MLHADSDPTPDLSSSARTLPDAYLVVSTAALLATGLVLVYSSSSVYAARLYHDPQRYLRAQALYATLGGACLLIAARTPRAFLAARSAWLWLLAMAACAAVLIPGVGHFVGGARRWLPLFGLSCQPSEFCKLSVVLLLASLLARRSDAQGSRSSLLLPVLLVQAPVALILCEPDLGTAMVIEMVMVLLLFVAGLRARTLVVLGLGALPVLYHLIVGTPFRLRRLLSYIDPWAYRSTTGYQVTEALISIGSGGLFGTGLGEGKQKLFFLPEAHTDFIFAVLAEELGFVGVVLLMGCFAVLVGRAMLLSLRTPSAFDRYLALGVAALIGIPAVFNACVATGLLPTKGLPLPFVSYGGSNLVVTCAAVGLLFRIDRDLRCPTAGPQTAEAT
jgi:cell division protein FtsW